MSHKSMYSSLPTIASVLAAQKGVRIIIGSQGPSTDIRAKVIYYPASCKAVGGERERILVEGWTDHECAHLALTDPEAGEAARNKFEFRLANAIEDARIEALYPKRFPGSKKILADMIREMANDGRFSPSGKPEPANIITMAVVTYLRATLLGQAVDTQAVQWGALLRQTVGAALKKQILDIAKVGATGATAWDALTAAQQIVDLLKSQDDTLEQQTGEGADGEPEDDAGEASSEAADGEGQGSSGQSSSDASGGPEGEAEGESDEGGSESSSDASGASQGASAGGTEGAVEGKIDSNPLVGEQARSGAANSKPGASLSKAQLDAIAGALKSTCAEGQEAVSQAIAEGVGAALPGEEPAEHEVLLATPSTTTPMVLSADGDAAMRSTARRFDALLASQADVHRQTVSEGGKLRRDRLYRAASGLFDVFERRSRSEGINTAISVSFDVSGSMGADGVRNSRETTLMLTTLLERWNVASHVMSFDHRITVFKDWGDSPRLMSSRILAGQHDGGTSMGAVLNAAVRALCTRQEERKVALIVTDGVPGSPGALNAAVSTAKRFGIETRFVLIGNVDPGDFRAKFANDACGVGRAKTLSEIPVAVFNAMRDALSH